MDTQLERDWSHLVGSVRQGIGRKLPDGNICRLFSIDNTGAMVLTPVACQ